MMAIEILPPSVSSVSLAEVKEFLRIDHADEDALLAGFVRSATELAEAFTGQKLLARDFTERQPAQPIWLRLSAGPVVSIDGIDASGSALPGAAYETDIDLSGDGWIRVIATTDKYVTVRYRAGMASDWNGIPEALRLGIIRLVSHFYAYRDAAESVGAPAAVAALWRPWRRIRV